MGSRATGRRFWVETPALVGLVISFALGCQSVAVPETPAPEPGVFWAEQAVLDFERLERIDDRSSGSCAWPNRLSPKRS